MKNSIEKLPGLYILRLVHSTDKWSKKKEKKKHGIGVQWNFLMIQNYQVKAKFTVKTCRNYTELRGDNTANEMLCK